MIRKITHCFPILIPYFCSFSKLFLQHHINRITQLPAHVFKQVSKQQQQELHSIVYCKKLTITDVSLRSVSAYIIQVLRLYISNSNGGFVIRKYDMLNYVIPRERRTNNYDATHQPPTLQIC